MKRGPLLALLGVLLLAGGGAFTNRERLILTWLGAKTEKRTLEEQEALLAPHLRVFAPSSGEPPFPAVVQFHGCAGYRDDFMAQWAKVANDEGFLVVAVDSTGPRGIDRETALASVCAGKSLIGQERAGDVAAALAIVAARDDVDPRRIVAAGWSHGAWSLMDYFALSADGLAPPSIKGAAPAPDPAAAVLFYPYCGEGTWSRLHAWRTKARILAFIAGADTIVDGAQCEDRLGVLKSRGAAIEATIYRDADHVFDDATLIGGDHERYYDADAHADAVARYAGLLRTVKTLP